MKLDINAFVRSNSDHAFVDDVFVKVDMNAFSVFSNDDTLYSAILKLIVDTL